MPPRRSTALAPRTVVVRSAPPARSASRSNGAVSKWRQRYEAEKKRASSIRKKIKDSEIPNTLMNAGAVLGGAAASSLIVALAGDPDTGEIFGLPAGPALGGGAALLGLYMGKPWLVYAGAGAIAPWISDMVLDMADDWYEEEDADAQAAA